VIGLYNLWVENVRYFCEEFQDYELLHAA